LIGKSSLRTSKTGAKIDNGIVWRCIGHNLDYYATEMYMNNIVFDEEKHEYTIDGERLPSVTEICEPISFKKLDAVNKVIVAKAAMRGTLVHELIENYIYTGEFSDEEVPAEIQAYLVAFANWWFTYKPTPLYNELLVGSKELGYCGTCDFVCKIDNKLTLIDFKTTSSIDKKYLSVQLYGYKNALAEKGINIEVCAVLHLKKDGDWNYQEIEPDKEWFELLLKHNKKMRSKYGK